MLMCVSSIQNPNEPTERAYKIVLCESIIDKDIGAQEIFHFLLELPLLECIYHFLVLNVGMKVFKQIQVDTYNPDNDNSLIDAYTKRPENMEQLRLTDVAK